VRAQKHGLGTFKSADGSRSYQGSWVNGRKEGSGLMAYGDGSTYQGNWHDDKVPPVAVCPPIPALR
jgi:hypothetical protein